MIARRLLFTVWCGLIPLAAVGERNSFVRHGDEAVLAPPVANFRMELQRLKLPAPRHRAMPIDSVDPAATNLVLEMNDLRAALEQQGASMVDIDRIVSACSDQYEKLKRYADAVQEREQSATWDFDEDGQLRRKLPGPEPSFPQITYPEGLPEEFAESLEAAVAERNPALLNRSFARAAWERTLQRSAKERRFQSVRAVYRLGRSWDQDDPERALEYYRNVRALAESGFHDTSGLAAASIGWEARIHLQRKDYGRALDMYLQHMAAGDPGAPASLVFTMRAILKDGASSLPDIARNPLGRRVVTAYMISTAALKLSPAAGPEPAQTVSEWLDAVNHAPGIDAELAEELALLAYQNRQWDLAGHWLDRSPSTPTAQWLRAKLLLRSGRTGQGLALLARVEPLFPSEASNGEPPGGLEGNLAGRASRHDWQEYMAADRQIRGEMGVIHLARGEYDLALHCFLRAGLWLDAAYVAEAVMTEDELKAFVDRAWSSAEDGDVTSDAGSRSQLRHLLARRLMRAMRAAEARAYYPPQLHATFENLVRALSEGWNDSLAEESRATALFIAAGITRTNGLELLATELAPDWHVCHGNREDTDFASMRSGEDFRLFPATADELARAARHRPDPDARFHYRYQAAFLAWEAAKLLPDHSDQTASVLWTAGTWLKQRDPTTADLFYKSLVWRCRRTELGTEADRIRWFPRIDDNGKVIPRKPRFEEMQRPAAEQLPREGMPSDYPIPGTAYVVHAGDSLTAIAAAASVWGHAVTAQSLLEANPGLNPARLVIGQKILIPPRSIRHRND